MDEIGNEVQYPALLHLKGKACLVVGGGVVSERKVASLLAVGAMVTVISPSLTDCLLQWACEGKIQVEQREYHTGDIRSRDALLVFAATGSSDVNAQICAEAASLCRLCNSIDEPERGSFTVPASIRRGRLQIAVSTSGASPSVAKRIAADIGESYGVEYETYLDFLHEVRLQVLAGSTDPVLRRKLLKQAAEWDVLATIREGSFHVWRDQTLSCLKEQLVSGNSASVKD